MSDFEVYSKSEKVNTCYGRENLRISREDIDALLNGKMLYSQVNDGEYAITILLEE